MIKTDYVIIIIIIIILLCWAEQVFPLSTGARRLPVELTNEDDE